MNTEPCIYKRRPSIGSPNVAVQITEGGSMPLTDPIKEIFQASEVSTILGTTPGLVSAVDVDFYPVLVICSNCMPVFRHTPTCAAFRQSSVPNLCRPCSFASIFHRLRCLMHRLWLKSYFRLFLLHTPQGPSTMEKYRSRAGAYLNLFSQ